MLTEQAKNTGTAGQIAGPGRGRKNGGSHRRPPLSTPAPTLADLGISKKISDYIARGGICCPECQSTATRVYYTRRGLGFFRRVRKCSRCGRTFATEERRAFAD
jgi:DNA-directed RNA polymerase subunit RPC12/RpoP